MKSWKQLKELFQSKDEDFYLFLRTLVRTMEMSQTEINQVVSQSSVVPSQATAHNPKRLPEKKVSRKSADQFMKHYQRALDLKLISPGYLDNTTGHIHEGTPDIPKIQDYLKSKT